MQCVYFFGLKYSSSFNMFCVGIIVKHIVLFFIETKRNEPVHEISINVVCATSKVLDQPAHTRSLIRAFASRLSIL